MGGLNQTLSLLISSRLPAYARLEQLYRLVPRRGRRWGQLEGQSWLLLSRFRELATIQGFLSCERPQPEATAGRRRAAGKHRGIGASSGQSDAVTAIVNSGPGNLGHADSV